MYKMMFSEWGKTFLKMFTYIMKCNNLHKIGKTNNIKERLNNFRTGNPFIELVKEIQGNHESYLHQYFKSKRIIGEWFNLTTNDISDIENLIANKKETITIKEVSIIESFEDKISIIMSFSEKGYLPKERLNVNTVSIEELKNENFYVFSKGLKEYMKLLKEEINVGCYNDYIDNENK